MQSPALKYARVNSGINFQPDAYTVLWFPGQDDPQSATIRDRSGSGNNGTITGATWTRNGNGIWYLDFDGADDIVNIPDATSIQNVFDGGGSTVAWIYPESDGEGNLARIHSKRNGWWWDVGAEAVGFVRMNLSVDFDGTDGSWSTTVSIPINTWSIVGVDYDSDATTNNPTFFVNNIVLTVGSGVTEASTPVGTRVTDAGTDLEIGNDPTTVRTWDGGIWGSRLRNTGLSSTQFQGYYYNERGLFGV